MELSVTRLIRQRMNSLDITRGELARRMGYSNIRKGSQRIATICAGDLFMAKTLREALGNGLGVDIKVIDRSIDASYREITNAVNQAYLRSFAPHAVIVTESGTDYLVTYYCSRAEARLRILHFVAGSSPETYPAQARDALPDEPPFLLGSRTIGYVVNYSPDSAVYFDTEGKEKKKLSSAFRVVTETRMIDWILETERALTPGGNRTATTGSTGSGEGDREETQRSPAECTGNR